MNSVGLTHWCSMPSHWDELLESGQLFLLTESMSCDVAEDFAQRYAPLEECRLYWGEMGEENSSISPYCIPVTNDNIDEVKEKILVEDDWGCWLWLSDEYKEYSQLTKITILIHQLRRWLLVTSEHKRDDLPYYLLRLSDWRVLFTLITHSNDIELVRFFGPIQGFGYNEFDVLPEWLEFGQLQQVDEVVPMVQQLSETQYHALIDFQKKQLYLVQCKDYLSDNHEDFRKWRKGRQLAFVEEGLILAERANIHQLANQCIFLSIMFVVGKEVLAIPLVDDILFRHIEMPEKQRVDHVFQIALKSLNDNE